MMRQTLPGLLLGFLVACSSQGAASVESDLHVEDVWAGPVQLGSGAAGAGGDHGGHRGGNNGALYMTLRDTRGEADRLLGAESPVAHMAEIHHSKVEDGIMRMRRVENVPVGAGETIELRPGGLHLMLIHLNRSLQPGDRFPVRLHFERAGWREVEAEVRVP